MRHTTLALIENAQWEILLAMKKKWFWVKLWNGPGGKIKSEETALDACVRETFEEVGIVLKKTRLKFAGIINFSFRDNPDWNQDMQIFRYTGYTGEAPIESEEMRPEWFKISDIPYDEMWPADRIWLPDVLKGEVIERSIEFDAEGKIVLRS